MEARKVQRVGYSTLTVSLPRSWVQEVNLKQGDVVTIKREDDGSLRVFSGLEQKREEPRKCIIDADLCDKPDLLTRLITGNYILGHDTIQVISKRELKPEHLEEIRRATQRLTGLGIVEQTLRQVTVQSFVDPTKFPVYGLIRRLHIVISSMQEAAVKSLVERRPDLANEVSHMESEADRIYWLVVRQLLLAIRDRTVGSKIGIESPLHVAGNRIVVKTLEEMADSTENIANEVLTIKELNGPSGSILEGIVKFSTMVQSVSDKVMKALLTLDVKLANDAIANTEAAMKEQRRLTERILTSVKEVGLAVSLRTIVWNLGEVARYAKIIGEIAINRTLEAPSEICRLEKA
ncbi:PhoU domain-containing protein [[Eubacterium] cellulosolvens]